MEVNLIGGWLLILAVNRFWFVGMDKVWGEYGDPWRDCFELEIQGIELSIFWLSCLELLDIVC